MVKSIFCTLLCCIFFLSVSAQKTKQSEREEWVDSVFSTLSQEQRVGQLFMIAAYSQGDVTHRRETLEIIREHQPGGILFMQGGPVRQVQNYNRFQKASNVPLMIGMDLEWGLGMRLDSTISFPRQMTLGALRDDSLISAMGYEIGRQMKLVGAHINFAPVADVNNNAANPVIGTRSFGEDPGNVSGKTVAYARGLQKAGVMAVAKHFPGHGDTDQDSHLKLPVLNHSKERLEAVELTPFNALIHDGIGGIMTAHLQVNALDDQLPASLSEKITGDYLRKDLGFDGLIFTDALNMRAISEDYPDGRAELMAFKAGADVLLFSTNIAVAKARILEAVEGDKKYKKQLEESVRRILRAKYDFGLNNYQPLNQDNLVMRLNTPEADTLTNVLFEKSVTVVANRASVLPVRQLDNKSFALLSYGELNYFTRGLNRFVEMPVFSGERTQEYLRDQLRTFDVVIVAVESIDENIDEIAGFIKSLEKDHKVITCYFGNVYEMSMLADSENLIVSYENNAQNQLATASIIFGALNADATLPVSPNTTLKAGTGVKISSLGRLAYALPEREQMDSETLRQIDILANEAITSKATPGCQVLVARKGRIVYHKSFGYHTYDKLVPVTEQTIYDLASVTKVMASTQALMFLVERGIIDLDKKVSVYLPELVGTNKENMILRDILTHQAGLWPFLPFWQYTMDKNKFMPEYYSTEENPEYSLKVSDKLFARPAVKDSIWQWVIDSKLRRKGARETYDYKYSDIGYYMIQRIIETTTNQSIADFMAQNFYEPMGMSSTGYRPLNRFPVSRIAPTENDTHFRKTLVVGRVHDQGAALFDGVAGHAGLFGTSLDLAKNLQMLLNGGYYADNRYFKRETVVDFTSQQYDNNRRGLGWDKPLMGEWYGPTSEYCSEQTFGHTGFTGTAIWVDPEYDLIYVFLSNRIYPDATNSKLLSSNIRTRIQDVIYKSIHEYESIHAVN